jgi:hypothetical protein
MTSARKKAPKTAAAAMPVPHLAPLPPYDWFAMADYPAYFKKCAGCGAVHYMSPRTPGCWSKKPFVCLHCAKKKRAHPSDDQGVYVGSVGANGMVNLAWKRTCAGCGTKFFHGEDMAACRDQRRRPIKLCERCIASPLPASVSLTEAVKPRKRRQKPRMAGINRPGV